MTKRKTVDDVFHELLEACNAARDLLAALDRTYGADSLSTNADGARERLRGLVSVERDIRDRRHASSPAHEQPPVQGFHSSTSIEREEATIEAS